MINFQECNPIYLSFEVYEQRKFSDSLNLIGTNLFRKFKFLEAVKVKVLTISFKFKLNCVIV